MAFSLPGLLRRSKQLGLFSACRNLLTDTYTNYPLTKSCETDLQKPKTVMYHFMDFDHCIERDYHVTSLMFNRLVQNTSNKDHVQALPYYFYKFRHTPNGYYLRPWTVHNFVKKSLEMDPQVAMEILRHKASYGVFPHVYSLNLVLDHFLKSSNHEAAMASACHLFMLEYLDDEIAQVLSLEAVNSYWNHKLQDSDVLPEIEDLEMQRNIAGILYTIGVMRSESNLTLIGLSMLGRIEKENDIRAIYQEPWAPLPWSEGYLQKALDELVRCLKPISQQCVDVFMKCCSQDEELAAKAQAAVEEMQSKNLITDDNKSTLNGICAAMKHQLPQLESAHVKSLEKIANEWGKEHNLLIESEHEMRSEVENKRAEYKRELELHDKSHQMAVVELGFYDLEKKEEDLNSEDLEVELRENYVQGSFFELDIVERMREKSKSTKNPVVMMSSEMNT